MKPIRYVCPEWCTASDHARSGAYVDELSEPIHSRSIGRALLPGRVTAHVWPGFEVLVEGADSEPMSREVVVHGLVESLNASQAEQLAGMLTAAARVLRRIEAGEDADDDDGGGGQVVILPTAQATSQALLEAWRRDMTVQGLSPRTMTDRLKVVTSLGVACDAPPESLTADQVADWLARDGLTVASRGTYAAIVRAWFGWLTRTKRRTDNPMG